jgi:hypothetical protein
MLNELSEAAATAFQDIYDNKNGMLDDLAAFWRYSAEQFRNEPAIIGYEIMNGCCPFPVVPPWMALSAQPHSARAIRRKLLRGPDPASPRRCGQEEPRADVRGNVRGNPVCRCRSAFGRAERALHVKRAAALRSHYWHRPCSASDDNHIIFFEPVTCEPRPHAACDARSGVGPRAAVSVSPQRPSCTRFPNRLQPSSLRCRGDGLRRSSHGLGLRPSAGCVAGRPRLVRPKPSRAKLPPAWSPHDRRRTIAMNARKPAVRSVQRGRVALPHGRTQSALGVGRARAKVARASYLVLPRVMLYAVWALVQAAWHTRTGVRSLTTTTAPLSCPGTPARSSANDRLPSRMFCVAWSRPRTPAPSRATERLLPHRCQPRTPTYAHGY